MRTYENDTTSREFLAGVADEQQRVAAIVRAEYQSALKRYEKARPSESPNAFALAACDLAALHAIERLADKIGVELTGGAL